MTPQQLHSQVGFYLLPQEAQKKKNSKKVEKSSFKSNWRSSLKNLDAIAEASGEEGGSRTSTPGRALAKTAETRSFSPKLLRKHTALPGMMFDRPTRHPSLDDLRGYGKGGGRKGPRAGGQARAGGRAGQRAADRAGHGSDGRDGEVGISSGDAYERMEALKLPPIRASGLDDRRTAATDFARCLHPQARICRNLCYNLHQMKIRSQEELYRALIGAIVVGPAEVESVDVEEVLGVRSRDFLRGKVHRNEIEEEGTQTEVVATKGKLASTSAVRVIEDSPDDDEEEDEQSPEEQQPPEEEEPETDFLRYGGFSKSKSSYRYPQGSFPARKYSLLMSRPGLRRQFERFAKYAEPGASGDFITEGQTEKWLKVAGVIDNWNVTTVDTANFFEKISKGSRWLDFNGFRVFLEELAWRKRLNIAYLVDKLEFAGSATATNAYTSVTGKSYVTNARLP